MAESLVKATMGHTGRCGGGENGYHRVRGRQKGRGREKEKRAQGCNTRACHCLSQKKKENIVTRGLPTAVPDQNRMKGQNKGKEAGANPQYHHHQPCGGGEEGGGHKFSPWTYVGIQRGHSFSGCQGRERPQRRKHV